MIKIFSDEFLALYAKAADLHSFGLESTQLRDLLSGLRGPDDESVTNKQRYTAPIRRFVFTQDAYNEFGFWPSYEDTEPLTEEGIWARIDEARKLRIMEHYFSHIYFALEAIAFLNGWTRPPVEVK